MAEKTHLQVEGMTCTNCALGVSRFLEKQGYKDVNVSFTTGDVTFESVEPVNLNTLKSGISALGYRLISEDETDQTDNTGSGFTLEKKLLISSLFTVPLLLHMIMDAAILHNPWTQLFLTIPVFIIGVIQFGRSAIASLKTGVPNMDVLIITGATAAFVYSLLGMVMHLETPEMHNYLFFETTATIITLVLLGNVIEKRSVKQTTSAIRELAALQPAAALKISIGADMSEKIQTVKPSELKKGDPVLINTGAAVPVDGTIYWGNASVDESALTGESLPVDKGNGDKLLAGSVLLSGTVKVITEKPGGQTLLSDIINLVKQAQSSKPPIQKLGDKVSAWFVPIVIGIALLTFLAGTFVFGIEMKVAIMSAVAVLVISCPCAMGLATPTAVAVGLGKAAKNGILIKGGDTLEQFQDIKTIVFDKTGTLTTGQFSVTSFTVQNNFNQQEIINTLVSLEQHSDHPIARSILESLAPKATGFVSFENADEIKGTGLTARDDKGNVWQLGSVRIIPDSSTEKGHTVYLTCNGAVAAWLDLTDEIRDSARSTISTLRNMGLEVVMLSGDNEQRCREVATETGIETVYSGQLPDQKTEVISQLRKKGKVIMIGDGINDAPSLTAADIGISFGQATKIAVNAAQVIIINSQDLAKIIYAIEIGKKTLTTIRQNLFWAFAYNVVAIPIAAVGLLSPMIAALSMAFSDVVVIGNSLRLKIFRN